MGEDQKLTVLLLQYRIILLCSMILLVAVSVVTDDGGYSKTNSPWLHSRQVRTPVRLKIAVYVVMGVTVPGPKVPDVCFPLEPPQARNPCVCFVKL